MKRAQRTGPLAVLVAAVLLLCAADIVPVSGGSMRGGEPAPDSGGGRSILLSVKIHGAKKRGRMVAFYKSVARQRKARGVTCGPSSPSGR